MKFVLPALALISLHPAVPSPVALLAGAALALLFGNPYVSHTKSLTPRLMAYSITGVGAGMNLIAVGHVGLHGLGYTALGIAMAFLFGTILNKWLRTDRITSILISAGTAICGGSAIAAVSPVIKAKPHQTSVALGCVFLLNAVALWIFPGIGHALDLSQWQFGMWSALAIHDTSSVVGASMQFGPQALEVGTTVKLARALWIVPMTLLIAWKENKDADSGKIKKPWFILGFLAMAALVTFVPSLKGPGEWIYFAAKRLFVMTLFVIGASFTRDALKAVGFKILFQSLILWILVSAGSLIAILSGWIPGAP